MCRIPQSFVCLYLTLFLFEFSDEGVYQCEVCTVFGLDKEEVKTLCGIGLKFTDQNKEAEGYEVKTSAFKASNKMEKSSDKWALLI